MRPARVYVVLMEAPMHTTYPRSLPLSSHGSSGRAGFVCRTSGVADGVAAELRVRARRLVGAPRRHARAHHAGSHAPPACTRAQRTHSHAPRPPAHVRPARADRPRTAARAPPAHARLAQARAVVSVDGKVGSFSGTRGSVVFEARTRSHARARTRTHTHACVRALAHTHSAEAFSSWRVSAVLLVCLFACLFRSDVLAPAAPACILEQLCCRGG
jgi:hypothetical protein